MAACELVFDEALLTAEPIEGGIDLVGGDAAEAQYLAQRALAVAASSIRVLAGLAARSSSLATIMANARSRRRCAFRRGSRSSRPVRRPW